ncbi:hypothetical protein ACC685_33515 [Rhizobium ruizarguesonis]
MAGRPKKIIPAGSSELTITIPNETRAFLEAQAEILDMPIGRLIRRAVETHSDLVSRLEQQHADMTELRGMFEEAMKSIRVIASYVRAEEIRQSDAADDYDADIEFPADR